MSEAIRECDGYAREHCQIRAPPIPMDETLRHMRAHKNERGGHEHDRIQAAMNVAGAVIAADASISVNGAKLELIDRGRGRPILFLHPHIGIEPSAPVLALLADGGRLVAPSHPGFGRSELPPTLTTVDDLAYFYLDAMEELDLEQTLVVGVSLGAWIAAAIAVKSTARMSRLVLANPVGIKVGDRESRDILDIFAMTEPEFVEKAFADSAAAQRDYGAMSEEELRIVARNREVDGALRLVALHARPQAQGPPAPHPHSDAGAVGHRRQADRRELWPRLLPPRSPARSSSPSKAPATFPHLERPKPFAAQALAFAALNSRY